MNQYVYRIWDEDNKKFIASSRRQTVWMRESSANRVKSHHEEEYVRELEYQARMKLQGKLLNEEWYNVHIGQPRLNLTIRKFALLEVENE